MENQNVVSPCERVLLNMIDGDSEEDLASVCSEYDLNFIRRLRSVAIWSSDVMDWVQCDNYDQVMSEFNTP